MHQWHRGEPSSSSRLAFWYPGVLYSSMVGCSLSTALASLRLVSCTTVTRSTPPLFQPSVVVVAVNLMTDTIRVYVVRTLHLRLHRCAVPYVIPERRQQALTTSPSITAAECNPLRARACDLLCWCLGAAPHRFTPRQDGCYLRPRRSAIISSCEGLQT